MQGPSGILKGQRSATFRAFCKNFQHRENKKGKGAMETLCSILQYVVAELKIKSSFYDDENRRTTEKNFNSFQDYCFQEKEN